MKPYMTIGVILILAAIAALAYQGMRFVTSDADLGTLSITAEKAKTLPLALMLGGIFLINGIAFLIVGFEES